MSIQKGCPRCRCPVGAGAQGERTGVSAVVAFAIEDAFYLTCCIIWSNEFPLTLAAEGVKKLLIEFVKKHVETTKRPGAVWLD